MSRGLWGPRRVCKSLQFPDYRRLATISLRDDRERPGRSEEEGGERGRERAFALSFLETVHDLDVAFRHQQALDPSALTTISSTLHAISKAMEDCRNAGVSAEEDPAVILLARHFSAVCDQRPAANELQGRCMRAIKDLRGAPVLVTLAHRGVYHEAAAKNAFHSEGQKAMRALAKALQLDSSEYEVRSCRGGPAVSGEIILHTNKCYVQLSLGLRGLDNEVLYRTCRGREDYTGGRNHFAGVRHLVEPDRFARRIVHELQLGYALPDQAETLFG